MDIVLGMSMAPASIQMVVVEGENADGAPQGSDIVVQWVNAQLQPVYPPGQALASPIAKPLWAG